MKEKILQKRLDNSQSALCPTWSRLATEAYLPTDNHTTPTTPAAS